MQRLIKWVRARWNKFKVERSLVARQKEKAKIVDTVSNDPIKVARSFVEDHVTCGQQQLNHLDDEDLINRLDAKHFNHLSREVDPLEDANEIPSDSVIGSVGDIPDKITRSPKKLVKPYSRSECIKGFKSKIPAIIHPLPVFPPKLSKPPIRRKKR